MRQIQSSQFRYLLAFALLALFLAPLAGLAAEEKPIAMEADYPGKYRLVWYFHQGDQSMEQPFKVLAHNKELVIFPDIKPPSINSMMLLENSQVNPGEDVLDMGTGSGLHAVFAAEQARRVVATDIEPHAVENARKNAELNGVAGKIDFRVGDLFAALKEDEKFDVIYWNIAYPFGEATLGRWKLHERFFAGVRSHLKPRGRIYYQVGFLRNIPYILDMLQRNGLIIMRMNMVNAPVYGREPITMLIQAN